METGTVVAMLITHAKAGSREEWEAGVESIWKDAIGELQTNPGFKGLVTMWNDDDSGQVSVIGLWDNMEHRLAYEARSSGYVRGLFNGLFKQEPDRPRFLISKAQLF